MSAPIDQAKAAQDRARSLHEEYKAALRERDRLIVLALMAGMSAPQVARALALSTSLVRVITRGVPSPEKG